MRPDDRDADPLDRLSLDESLVMLLRVVLESLTPEERVAFILHDVFGVPFPGIAEVVGRSANSTRDLTRSARRQVRHRTRADAMNPDQQRAVVLALVAACAARDEEAVRALLSPSITVLVDTGGNALPAPAPVRGAEHAARLLIRLIGEGPEVSVTEQPVNGSPGLVLRRAGRVMGVLGANIDDGRIVDAWVILNPDKLRGWNER